MEHSRWKRSAIHGLAAVDAALTVTALIRYYLPLMPQQSFAVTVLRWPVTFNPHATLESSMATLHAFAIAVFLKVILFIVVANAATCGRVLATVTTASGASVLAAFCAFIIVANFTLGWSYGEGRMTSARLVVLLLATVTVPALVAIARLRLAISKRAMYALPLWLFSWFWLSTCRVEVGEYVPLVGFALYVIALPSRKRLTSGVAITNE